MSRRDLPYALSKGLSGGTTVAATMMIAHKVISFLLQSLRTLPSSYLVNLIFWAVQSLQEMKLLRGALAGNLLGV